MSTTLNADIGRRIAGLRRDNHLTQAKLAEKLDISIKHLSCIERGLACLSLDKLILLCDILSTNLDYLIRGRDCRNENEAQVPTYILDLFKSDDDAQKELVQEYFLMFRKIYDTK